MLLLINYYKLPLFKSGYLNESSTEEKTKGEKIQISDPKVQSLAQFLNLDMKRAGDIRMRWHSFQSWMRDGVPAGRPADDLKRYEELKPIVGLLEERHVDPSVCPDLLDWLQELQDNVRARLQPIIERDETRIRWAVQVLVEELNTRRFRAQWEVYASEAIMGMNWARTMNPEKPNYIDRADPALFGHHQRRLKIDNHHYVVKPVFSPNPMPSDPNSLRKLLSESIANRLYWLVGQTLVDATIDTLKMCAECGKYFAAYDGKQKYCSPACAKVENDKDKVWPRREVQEEKKGDC